MQKPAIPLFKFVITAVIPILATVGVIALISATDIFEYSTFPIYPTLTVILGGSSVLIIAGTHTRFKEERITKEAYEKAITTTAEDQPHAVRDLTKEERQSLFRTHSILFTINNLRPHLIAAAIFLLGISFYLKAHLDYVPGIITDTLTGVVILVWISFKENAYYKDLSLPVWQTRGKAIKHYPQTIVVNGIKFRVTKDEFDSLKVFGEPTTVSIEYSPTSKHIWKIELDSENTRSRIRS